MKEIKLTVEEKAELELRHKRNRDKKESDRIKAILLRSESWTIAMISQALRIHESTVAQHIEDYQKGKLKIESGGSSSLLDEKQSRELISHLEENTYQTTQEIIHYIKNKYKITYSVPGMNKWLHRKGFSYKKPKGYPYKASKEKQESFIKAYIKLKTEIKTEDEIIFMDSCHPSMATKITHGWIKKGQDKGIETTASRTRINIVGALSLNNLSNPIVASYDTINGEAIGDFLYFVRKHTNIKGTIHVILDQAGYHKSIEVISIAKQLNIRLIYLPPYSPNLNPIERLWKVLNEHARNNKFFETADDFRKAIDNFFINTLPKIAFSLHARINDNFQSLNYAFSG
jgi:transposase